MGIKDKKVKKQDLTPINYFSTVWSWQKILAHYNEHLLKIVSNIISTISSDSLISRSIKKWENWERFSVISEEKVLSCGRKSQVNPEFREYLEKKKIILPENAVKSLVLAMGI